MAGEYWGKGNNPYWNFDSDASLRNSQMNDAYKLANDARLNTQQAQFETSMAQDEVQRLRTYLNQTINSHKKEIDTYEQRLKNNKTVIFKLAIRSNIFERTLVKLTEEWSDKKDYILDEIQCQKNLCSTQEYRDNWWGWVNQEDPSSDHSYLDFPFPERVLKNKP
ncbi:hypothetical protein DRK59_24215 [Salmonella enterica subsp. diarizonae]|uniref:hypothetical protein n=1 Tax=Salmonella enterica TaxID=28901 RepID=UPI000FB8293B|nr:hypothetical protein [Salmonella enterica]ECE0111495.1 hypothetical protein [Salmonella enterica subsp. diarizonae]EAQ6117394.1 hypothetical protein [Salmonella enterica]EDW9104201.1 hypothetical protein [Salmonella enterica subsp. diarizonae]EGT7826348.1 hypothetical protein [Salmonella enterica]